MSGVRRESDADDCAAVLDAQRTADAGPDVTLSGRNARLVRDGIEQADIALTDITNSKLPRYLKGPAREALIKVRAAWAAMPRPQRSTPPDAEG